MSEQQGTVSIVRTQGNERPDTIRIILRHDPVRMLPQTIIELTPADFALAVTGLSDVPCVYRVREKKT